MNRKPYNGHTNYETWLMATWFCNDDEVAEMVGKMDCNPHTLALLLRDKAVNDMPDLNGVWAGLLIAAFSESDWGGVAGYLAGQSDVGKLEAEI